MRALRGDAGDPATRRRARSLLGVSGLRRRLAESAGWSLLGATASRGLGLVSTLVAARLLVPRRFGQLSLVEAMVVLLGGVATLGLRVVATKRIAETRSADPEGAGRYAGFVLVLTAAAGAVVAGIALAGAGWTARELLLDASLAPVVAGAAGIVWFTSLAATEAGVLTGLEAFRALAVLHTIESLLASALLVVGILVDGLGGGVVGWMIGEAAAAGTGVVLVARACRLQGIRVRFDRRRADWRVLARLGIPAFAASLLVQAALLGAQRALAGGAGGLSRVAAFNVAYRWQLLVLFVPSALAPIMLPVMANLRASGEAQGARKVFRVNLVVNLALVVAGSALVLGLGRQVLALTGDFYSAQTRVLGVLLLGAVPVVLNNVLSQAALALDAVAAWVWSDVGLALALVGTALLLVPAFGAVGLGVAYLAGYLVTCLALVGPVRARLVASVGKGGRCASP